MKEVAMSAACAVMERLENPGPLIGPQLFNYFVSLRAYDLFESRKEPRRIEDWELSGFVECRKGKIVPVSYSEEERRTRAYAIHESKRGQRQQQDWQDALEEALKWYNVVVTE